MEFDLECMHNVGTFQEKSFSSHIFEVRGGSLMHLNLLKISMLLLTLGFWWHRTNCTQMNFGGTGGLTFFWSNH